MKTSAQHQVTHLLLELKQGNKDVIDELTPLIYQELKKLASHYLKGELRNKTIQTTDLVHEVYLRLIYEDKHTWENRAHFFGVAARAMRQYLIYYARRRKAVKRGGGEVVVTLDEGAFLADEKTEQILALDESLSRLEEFDDRLGRIVELRYFTGLTIEETAKIIHISPATVKREWNTAKAWLHQDLNRN